MNERNPAEMGKQQGAIMNQRFSAGTIVACIALAGGLFLLNGQPQRGGSAVVPSAHAAEADLSDAAAGVTFKIVAADVMAPNMSERPLTGEGY